MLKLLFLFLFAIITFSCSVDTLKSKSDAQNIDLNSYQIAGCTGSGLLKVVSEDSCFTYLFQDTLELEFCVVGNCCPDSLRFISTINVNFDTIFASVVDTAANLCDCVCIYKVHLEISGLSEERYLFYCDFPIYYDTLEYREYVYK